MIYFTKMYDGGWEKKKSKYKNETKEKIFG